MKRIFYREVKLMIFSDHVLLRFIQRVIGIKEETEALSYLENNKYEVYYKLLRLINKSEILYKNFSPSSSKVGETYTYLLYKDILTVVSVNKNVVVTLYDITVDIDESRNIEKIRKYAKKIKQNEGEYLKKNAAKVSRDHETRKLEILIEEKEKELKNLKEKLTDEIEANREIYTEAKRLKNENRKLMENIMFGFKKFR